MPIVAIELRFECISNWQFFEALFLCRPARKSSLQKACDTIGRRGKDSRFLFILA